MISHIEGQVLFVEANAAIVATHGVGYHVLLSKKALESVLSGQTRAFFIHTHVREDAFELYGFLSRLEKQIFLLLINVSGVGPKLALTILSTLSPGELIGALIDKDITKLSSIPGIGKKTAERLSLELKDKAMKIDLPLPMVSEQNSIKIHLEQAIKSLGYSKAQSDRALLNLDHEDFSTMPLEELIKKTLSVLRE